MTLAYRSIFTVLGDQADTEGIVLEQFNEWIKRDPVRQPRNLDRDLYKLNSVTVFNPETELIYFEHKTQDGNRTLRARLIENKTDSGRWITTITLFFSKKNSNETVIMYEGDAPMETDRFGARRPMWVGRPGLVKRILEVVDACDVVNPSVKLLMRPEVIHESADVEALLDALCDPDRRISLLVAGSKTGESANSKIEIIDNLMQDAMGTASAFILTPEASRFFNDLVGSDHGVWYDNVRLYVPDFDPAVALNSRNHPIIKRDQLDSPNISKAKKFVGFIARRELTAKPMKFLNRDLSRIEESLVDREYQILISGEKILPRRSLITVESIQDTRLPEQVSKYLAILDTLRRAIGIDDITPEVLDNLTIRIQGYDLLAERLLAVNTETRESEFKLDLLTEELDDTIILHAEVYEENKKLRDQVKFLRTELVKSDRKSNAWLPTPEEMQEREPVTFGELLERITELEFLLFTGDESIATELDVTELGARSGSAWNELSGLNDYCKAKQAGLVRGGIMQYIDNLPNDYRPITKKNFRGKESESVERNPGLRNQRLMSVPTSVDVTGKALMFSHITIGKRLHIHFLDDFSNSGKIYIGRIGLHLDTSSTN